MNQILSPEILELAVATIASDPVQLPDRARQAEERLHAQARAFLRASKASSAGARAGVRPHCPPARRRLPFTWWPWPRPTGRRPSPGV